LSSTTPALLDQVQQRAHRHTLRVQRSQSFAVLHQQFKRVLGVGRIVLGTAGLECFAVLRQGRRVDRKEHEEVVLLQRIDPGPLGQLKRDGNGAAESLSHRHLPLVDRIDLVFDARELASLAVRALQTDVVLLVGPIDADEGGELVVAKRLHGVPPAVSSGWSGTRGA
jgi:hypothetical protein